jgi:hypothetical protein
MVALSEARWTLVEVGVEAIDWTVAAFFSTSRGLFLSQKALISAVDGRSVSVDDGRYRGVVWEPILEW